MAATVLYDSIIYGTLAEILARSGLHTHQRAVATDYNNTWLYWNGSAWKWAKTWQPLSLLRTDYTLPADTAANVALSYTLPALGANDMLRICEYWTVTNNANVKSAIVKLNGNNGRSMDLAGKGSGNLVLEMRNQNNAAVQDWFNNNSSVFGAISGAKVSTTENTAVAGKVLEIIGQKATAGDTMTLEWADIWICGGD